MIEELRDSTPVEEGKEYLNFRRVVTSIKQVNRQMAESLLSAFNTRHWWQMVKAAEATRPDFYEHMQDVLQAVVQGQDVTEKGDRVIDKLAKLGQALIDGYNCDYGFGFPAAPTYPVVVNLDIPKPITGLPEEVVVLSDKLAEDHLTFRKWTFGFDNRQFLVDLTPEMIERLMASKYVRSLDFGGEARIMEYPTYDPNGVNTDWGVTAINVDHPWNVGNYGKTWDGRSAKVCVIDTGIKSSHEAFWKEGECVYKGGYNFVANNENPADDHDHGTFCCGIVAAQHNSILGSYKGIAPDIELYACKVLDSKGSGNYNNIAAGVDWARTNGMHVISMSLGGPSDSSVLRAACDAAWYAGIITIAAAGNTGPNPNTVNYPAKYGSVVAIAASDRFSDIAGFSSRGPEVELTAPGVAIVGPWAGFTYGSYVVAGSSNRYICASGTSAACPHAAAYAALIKSWYWAATNAEIRQWMVEHAVDM